MPSQQPPDRPVVETHFHHLGRIAGDDRIGRHIVRHHGFGGDDGAMADFHAGQDHRLHADPHIAADHRVAAHLLRPCRRVKALFPAMAENVERIGRKAGHGVVGAVHDEARAFGDGAELADDQLVADEGIVVQHAFLREFVRPVRVVIIGEVADLDVRRRHQRLQEADALVHRDRMLDAGVGSVHVGSVQELQQAHPRPQAPGQNNVIRPIAPIGRGASLP